MSEHADCEKKIRELERKLDDARRENRQKLDDAKRKNKQLQKLAHRDELTKLLNRRGFGNGFERFLGEAFASGRSSERRSHASKTVVSLAIIDVDHFKKLNDVYGHDAGDEALKVLAKLLTKLVRHIDFVARWGGEEFVVGFVGANEEDAARIVEKIRAAVEKLKISYKREKLCFTISAGVATSNRARSFDELLRKADRALLKAKGGGRNRVVRYSQAEQVPSIPKTAVAK
ncbi:MAG: GGDEF domain-containing protein [Patescibacteria group bacterium]|nr:GGDEF domain-containing protein [Patescibacteria group bacterium]